MPGEGKGVGAEGIPCPAKSKLTDLQSVDAGPTAPRQQESRYQVQRASVEVNPATEAGERARVAGHDARAWSRPSPAAEGIATTLVRRSGYAPRRCLPEPILDADDSLTCRIAPEYDDRTRDVDRVKDR
jgi:hypothetical protein